MKIIKTIFFFCSGLLLTTISFELFLSFAGIMNPIVKIDSIKGERYIPNKTCNSLFIGEGFGLDRTNSQGWFGKEYIDNSDSLISIAIIGNSFVSSRQVFERNNFLTICENSMNNNLKHPKAAIYNFGKESMPIQELLFIKEEIKIDYNPDYIVILINDKNFNSPNRLVPYYELKNDKLVLNTSFSDRSVFKLYSKIQWLSNSSLLFLGYRVKNYLKKSPQIILDKFYVRKKLDHQITNIVETKINLTDQTIIKTLNEDEKVIFLLDVDSNMAELLKSLIDQSPVIDLTNALTKMKNDQGINPYYWKISNEMGHWNNDAHIVVGKELAKNLLKIYTTDKNTPHNTQ